MLLFGSLYFMDFLFVTIKEQRRESSDFESVLVIILELTNFQQPHFLPSNLLLQPVPSLNLHVSRVVSMDFNFVSSLILRDLHAPLKLAK
jgi:hypothetical protein